MLVTTDYYFDTFVHVKRELNFVNILDKLLIEFHDLDDILAPLLEMPPSSQ